jgi:hypothetical protein
LWLLVKEKSKKNEAKNYLEDVLLGATFFFGVVFVEVAAFLASVFLTLTGFAILESAALSLDALLLWIILCFAALSTVETALATDFDDLSFFAVLTADFRASRSISFSFSRFLSCFNFLIAEKII